MKKLLVDAHVFDYIHEGVRTYIKGLYSNYSLEKDSYELTLIAHDIQNLKNEFGENKGIKYIKLRFKNKFVRYFYEIPKIIRKYKFDFAHFNYALPFFKSKSCKYILTIHDVLFLDFPSYFSLNYRVKHSILFNFFIPRSDILLTVSNYSKNQILNHFSHLNLSPLVTPNGVDSKNKSDCEIVLPFEKYILLVSRIEPRKNHKILLDTYLKLQLWRRDIGLVLVGNYMHETKEIEELLKELKRKANNHFQMRDNVSDLELNFLYENSTLCVYPSYCEGFGIPPLESGIRNIPTLCSNQTAMKDFDFFGHFHFDPHDYYEFESKLLYCLDSVNSVSITKSCFEISSEIKKRFDWKISYNTIKEVIVEG